MRGWIARDDDSARTFADEAAILDDYRAEALIAGRDRLVTKRERAGQKWCGIRRGDDARKSPGNGIAPIAGTIAAAPNRRAMNERRPAPITLDPGPLLSHRPGFVPVL